MDGSNNLINKLVQVFLGTRKRNERNSETTKTFKPAVSFKFEKPADVTESEDGRPSKEEVFAVPEMDPDRDLK